jgi:hypothetical protein
MFTEDLMDILTALRQEQSKLQHQLKGIETAISALNGSANGSQSNYRADAGSHVGFTRRRTMSAAAKAKISKATKERWARYRAEKAKKAK